MSLNSFNSRSSLEIGGRTYEIFRLNALQAAHDVSRLPFSLKVLLENLLRNEDGVAVTASDITALARWNATAKQTQEIAFTPARVVMQDFTGVPAVVDLAAMREAMVSLGGDPAKINPLVPAELVIDHSVQVDRFGSRDAFRINAEREFERNRERYAFLRWGQQAFNGFQVVPPDTGIVHQVNLEYLSRVVFQRDISNGSPAGSSTSNTSSTSTASGSKTDSTQPDTPGGLTQAYPDTVVGTDSHTTMINGLGVLGWGVGGIEAEAAMLGQPMSMLIPQVLGVKLFGDLREGATATDLVLTVTEMLRHHGVVGKFVEFFGPGVPNLPLADRATIGNMSPEFGSTCAIFPIDAETLNYLRFTGRPDDQIELIEAYAREQGLWHDADTPEPMYSETIELDLGEVVPSLAGPKRPQDRVALTEARSSFRLALQGYFPDTDENDDAVEGSFPASDPTAWSGNGHDHSRYSNAASSPNLTVAHPVEARITPAGKRTSVDVTLTDGTKVEIDNGHVAIAAITSCTNTSNPSVMIAAGLLARNAVQRGLDVKPWVKTSLAPGSKVVMEYYERSGLTEYLEALNFHLVGYGCTTCIGNSGPLDDKISEAIAEHDLAVCSVLSGNRNFEGRINPDVKMNYLASPPLVVAYALAGTMDIDLLTEPIGHSRDGSDVYLRDIWPGSQEIDQVVKDCVQSDMFHKSYADVFEGDERWNSLPTPDGDVFDWDPNSTYVRRPTFFEGLTLEVPPVEEIANARVLAILGDSVTTDHISPAGAIRKSSPAAQYLNKNGVSNIDFNSYGSRRGNHEVMVRGTFANIRLRNLLAPGTEGGVTRVFPSGEEMTIFDAAAHYAKQNTPLIVLAGKEYGSGSSRDWAAKGSRLLGVRAVIAESFERIHRSNLVGMGVLPLQFAEGESAHSLGLVGDEEYSILGLGDGAAKTVTVVARRNVEGSPSTTKEFTAVVRIDTPKEVEYYLHGGILQFVLRQLAAK